MTLTGRLLSTLILKRRRIDRRHRSGNPARYVVVLQRKDRGATEAESLVQTDDTLTVQFNRLLKNSKVFELVFFTLSLFSKNLISNKRATIKKKFG